MIGPNVTMILVILINVSTCIANHENIKTTASADLSNNITSDARSYTVSTAKTELTASAIFSTTDVTSTLSAVNDADSTTSTRKLSTRITTANTFPTETLESTRLSSTRLPSTIIPETDSTTSTRTLSTRSTTANNYSPFPTGTPESTTLPSTFIPDADSTTSTRTLSTRTTTANTYSPSFPSYTTESTTLPSTIILDAGALLIRIDLNVSIEKPFTPELNNQSSSEYKITSDAFLQSLRTAFGTMPNFSGIRIKRFRNGSTVCDFGLLLDGNVNLTSSDEAFDRSLTYLENVTVFGNPVEFQSANMKAVFSQAAAKQTTGDVCNVYEDIIYCEWGYTCHRTSNGNIICTLDCSSLSTSCLHNGGKCVFDRKNNQSFCLCTIDACGNDPNSLNTEIIVAIVFGVVGIVLTVVIAVVGVYCKRRTDEKRRKESDKKFSDIREEITGNVSHLINVLRETKTNMQEADLSRMTESTT